ncbi:hydroxyproline-rich systemin-like [Solanum dulcamara]|uniref:hydroxyproline-rich systemin-like n=1 Tax=Solanum dulcamara TaxID=45834 RepID=UPI0024865C31|nr:hydroxyproline-rich systemin-like [Solanum dulcamara]
MTLFFRAFFILIIISFLILVGAEARTLLGSGNHDGMVKLKDQEIDNYGRKPYVTPSPPKASPSTKQEIVGRQDHHLLPPPSPKHDPNIGQLTSSTSPHHDTALIITVGRNHGHVPAPPAPKPEDEQGQIIITFSSDLPLQASY